MLEVVKRALKMVLLSGLNHPHNRVVTPRPDIPNCAMFHARQRHDKQALSLAVLPPSPVWKVTAQGADDAVSSGVPSWITALC
jgi:hypothetical protein